MRKRSKFVLVSGILAVGLLASQWVKVDYRYQVLMGLGLLAYGLSSWALKEDLRGVGWGTALILPTLYPISVGWFYFLLPQQWLSLVLILTLFGVGMYALLLTANIFSVAAIRTIQLLRAAHAVGFLLTLVTGFFLFDTVLSFRYGGLVNAGLAGGLVFPLLLQGLWSIELTESFISRRVWLYSLGLAGLLAGMLWALSFWPVGVAVGSLFLVAMVYVGLGLTQQYLTERLFENTVREYLAVGLVVIITLVLLTRWTG